MITPAKNAFRRPAIITTAPNIPASSLVYPLGSIN
jgi:hypothetical protein